MSRERKILIFGGIALAVLGMTYGLYYAVFVEHQTLDQMGGSLAAAFVGVAERNWQQSESSLASYRDAKYRYVRQVDVHSHWGGLAMLMIVLGVAFDELRFGERTRVLLAWSLLIGSGVFPLGVMLQTVNLQILGSVLAIGGSGLVILGLGATAVGFARA
jgi:hypothetical protein